MKTIFAFLFVFASIIFIFEMSISNPEYKETNQIKKSREKLIAIYQNSGDVINIYDPNENGYYYIYIGSSLEKDPIKCEVVLTILWDNFFSKEKPGILKVFNSNGELIRNFVPNKIKNPEPELYETIN